jgi:hypothetical protein
MSSHAAGTLEATHGFPFPAPPWQIVKIDASAQRGDWRNRGTLVGSGTIAVLAGLARLAVNGVGLEKQGLIAMPRENDLEGMQDQGGKHGGQKGMPKPEPAPARGPDQGIVRDERGQEQPRDKERAQQVSRQDKGGDPPGVKPGKRP